MFEYVRSVTSLIHVSPTHRATQYAFSGRICGFVPPTGRPKWVPFNLWFHDRSGCHALRDLRGSNKGAITPCVGLCGCHYNASYHKSSSPIKRCTHNTPPPPLLLLLLPLHNGWQSQPENRHNDVCVTSWNKKQKVRTPHARAFDKRTWTQPSSLVYPQTKIETATHASEFVVLVILIIGVNVSPSLWPTVRMNGHDAMNLAEINQSIN